MLRVALAEKASDGRTKLRKVGDVLVSKPLAGDLRATREILDRLEGRPPMMGPDLDGTTSTAIVVKYRPRTRGSGNPCFAHFYPIVRGAPAAQQAQPARQPLAEAVSGLTKYAPSRGSLGTAQAASWEDVRRERDGERAPTP
jgi:hypothetical protein